MQSSPTNKQNIPVPKSPNIPNSSPKKPQLQPLVSVIQSHLLQQSKRLFQDQIFKESVVKCSLDKDFAYLFEESGLKIKKQKPQMPIAADTKKSLKTYSLSEKNILKWTEGECQKALIHVPFKCYLDCFDLLHQKLNKKLLIVVTEFHEYYSEKLEEINSKRKDTIKWASLSSSLTVETKSKILELYELQKLELLLLSPELFENEKYQSFKCDTLFVTGIHLFQNKLDLLNRIVEQCQPARIIGGYEYTSRALENKLKWVNFGRTQQFENTVWLKGINKNKNLLSYLSKRQHSRILVIVRDKKSADELSSSLALEAYKLANLLDFIPKQVVKAFSLPNLLTTKKQSLQQLLHESFKRCCSSSLIISPFFQGLRLFQFDLIVYYDQPSIKQYMQLESLAINKLGLLSDEDYYICRNLQTSSIIDRSIFQRLTTNILERKSSKPGERKIKRFYSDNLSEISTNEPPVPNIKSIIINKYCHEYQISQPQLFNILNLLKQLNMLVMMDPVKYQCLIEERSAEQFKTIFPNYNLITRRINILNLASELKTTTQIVLDTMKTNGIRFLVCQQLLPLKILVSHVESSVETAWLHQQQQVLREIRQIDLSYTLFEQFTFPNSQFIRKEKLVTKRKQMMGLFELYLKGQLELSRLPLMKLNSVGRKTIGEWVVEVMEEGLTVHDMVLFLQGTLNQRTAIYQDESIFKNFYKAKYEELAELVEGCRTGKKQKI